MKEAESLLRSWAREVVYKYPEKIKSARHEALKNRNFGMSLYILATCMWFLDYGRETFISWLAIIPFLVGTVFFAKMNRSNENTQSLEVKYVKIAWLMGREDYASVVSWDGEDNFERYQRLSEAGIDLSERFKSEREAWESTYVPF